MSIQLVQPYYNNIGQLIRYGNTCNEMSLRQAESGFNVPSASSTTAGGTFPVETVEPFAPGQPYFKTKLVRFPGRSQASATIVAPCA